MQWKLLRQVSARGGSSPDGSEQVCSGIVGTIRAGGLVTLIQTSADRPKQIVFELMSTLVFMPWAVVSNPGRVCEFELRPVLLAPRVRDTRDWMNATPDIERILGAYRTPPDNRIRAATLVRYGDRDFTADLAEAAIDRVFALNDAVAFAGLSQRQFFAYDGYSNRDSYQFIAQRFVPNAGGVSIVHRRRDGQRTTGIPEELWSAHMEGHVVQLGNFKLDFAFASQLLSEMDGSEEVGRAIRSFNEANTDRSALSEAQELVSTVSAFQQLLGVRGGNTNETTKRFVEVLATIHAVETPIAAKAKAREKLERGKSLRAVWMDDLGVLRGSVGHGHSPTAYPSVWTAQEHLLLAAFVFPLFVKLRMSNSGRRGLTEEEQDSLAAFDLMLASDNLLGAVELRHGVPVAYEWNRVRLLGIQEARRQRASSVLRHGPESA